MNDCSTIVGQLVQRRKQLGLSQEVVAVRVGVHQPNFSEWECGKRQPVLDSLLKWVRALECDIRLSARV